jgi:hypothetical protein
MFGVQALACLGRPMGYGYLSYIADERARAFVQRTLEGEAGSAIMSVSEQAAFAPAVTSPGYLLVTRTGFAYYVLFIRIEMW